MNIWRQINPFPKVVRDYMNIWRRINPFPKVVRDYMEYMKYMKWDIYNYDVGNKDWSLRQNLGVSYGGGVPRDVLEGGALSASLISRHHLNASCCRAGAGYLKHKEAASWPLFWGQLIISPHLSSYSLFSLVVQMLSNSNFITPSHFHFGAKCPGFLLHFMWEGMSIRRELPYITPFFISLLDIITVDQYHIITFDQFNIITLAVKESFSANQYRQDQWTVRFGVPWHVILNLSMSPDTIRAIYLGPLHFVDYDGWDQTSFIVPGTGLLVILCNAAHVFSLLACEKHFYHFGSNNVTNNLVTD